MDLNEILARQIDMDESHGFSVDFLSEREKFSQLTKDLVGLFGEIGEFSNIVKKINIKLDHPEESHLDISVAEQHLHEELVDSIIYIFRLAAILKIDLQAEILKKMKVNATRYERFQRK